MFGIQTICLRNNNRYLTREQAAAVKGRGWAGNLASVEDLWSQRYRKTIEDPHGEGDWPVPGPPNLLWAFTDARDAAQAFRLAIENDNRADAGHPPFASDKIAFVPIPLQSRGPLLEHGRQRPVKLREKLIWK